MVEKLLQFLIGEVDAKLLKSVELFLKFVHKAVQEAININYFFPIFPSKCNITFYFLIE